MGGEVAPPASGDRNVGQGIVESDLALASPGTHSGLKTLPPHNGSFLWGLRRCERSLSMASSPSQIPGSCLRVIRRQELAVPQGM